MAKPKAKSVKSKYSTEVAEIFSQLKKNDGVKLSMLQEAALVKKLASQHNLKPVEIQKGAKISVPQIYNLMNIASMSPKMKAYVKSGKLCGTDALNIFRKAKDEKEFVKIADKLISTKVDRRFKNNKDVAPKKSEETTSQPKKGRGRPRKEKVEINVKPLSASTSQKDDNSRKEKIKNLILNFLGKKISKTQNNSLNDLVENLIAN